MKKGDVFGVVRIVGIMVVKWMLDFILLCYFIVLMYVEVELVFVEVNIEDEINGQNKGGVIEIVVIVFCDGKMGVEMEVFIVVLIVVLIVYDMCKVVDKVMVIEGLRVVFKEGGKSGRWEML